MAGESNLLITKKTHAKHRPPQKSYPQAKTMKNLINLKSQEKNKKVIHRGITLDTTCGIIRDTPNQEKVLKKCARRMRAHIREGFRIVRKPALLSQAIMISFSDCAGLKEGNGLLTARRTLTAELLGRI